MTDTTVAICGGFAGLIVRNYGKVTPEIADELLMTIPSMRELKQGRQVNEVDLVREIVDLGKRLLSAESYGDRSDEIIEERGKIIRRLELELAEAQNDIARLRRRVR